MTSRADFLHDPADFRKGTYGSETEFETFALFVCIYLFVAFLSLMVF